MRILSFLTRLHALLRKSSLLAVSRLNGLPGRQNSEIRPSRWMACPSRPSSENKLFSLIGLPCALFPSRQTGRSHCGSRKLSENGAIQLIQLPCIIFLHRSLITDTCTCIGYRQYRILNVARQYRLNGTLKTALTSKESCSSDAFYYKKVEKFDKNSSLRFPSN